MNRDSRRARLVLVLLLLTSLTLVTLDFRAGKGGVFGRVRSGASSVFGPIERAVADAVAPVGRAFASLGHLGGYKGAVDRLTKENIALHRQIAQDGVTAAESAQLRSLLGLAGADQDKIVPARVIALGGALGFDWVATLDAGSHAGLRVNQTVMNGQGLVGRITTVGAYTSQVVLANDPKVEVGARLVGQQQIGYVRGGALGPMTYTPYSPNVHPKAGQQVVTAGSLYAPGIPIGTVTRATGIAGSLTAVSYLRPVVDYTALDVVGVVVSAPPAGAAGPTLPPRPTVTVTVTRTAAASPSAGGSAAASPSGGGTPAPGRTPSAGATPSPGASG